MTTKIIQDKIVLHVPLKAFIDGELEDLNVSEEIKELESKLEESGITSFYKTEATGFYKGRSYPEELITIYDKNYQRAMNRFFEWNKKYRKKFKQEAFAYELEGQLYVCEFEPRDY